MIKNIIKSKIKLLFLVLFSCIILLYSETSEANICSSESDGIKLYGETTLSTVSHLQEVRVGDNLRIKGRIVFDYPDYMNNEGVYGCGFSVGIIKDAYTPLPDNIAMLLWGHKDDGTDCVGEQMPNPELGIFGGDRVDLPEGKAGCDIDATIQIPSSYYGDQKNNVYDYLVFYPWWSTMVDSGEFCTAADFGSQSYGDKKCKSFNFGIFHEHLKLISDPIPAVCGTNATTFPSTTTNWPSTINSAFCSSGTLLGLTPTFPNVGKTVTWTCQGLNGGANISCSASRLNSYTITAINSGSGSGSFVFNPSGTSCGNNCNSYVSGSNVSVTANANTGSTFERWKSGCDFISGNKCDINNLQANKTIEAVFNPIPPCIPDCGDPADYCSGKYWSDGCGGNCGPGTKNCNSSSGSNWREVTP